MIGKPEMLTFVEEYGYQTECEYNWLIKKLDELDIETLNNLIACVYKEGIRDGIQLYIKLDTKG